MLRKNDDFCAAPQQTKRLPEREHDPRVMINRNRVGIVKNQHAQRCDKVGKQPVKPVRIPGLHGPEILIGIGGHLFELHHLRSAPGVPAALQIKLRGNGAVHVGMISHDHRFALRQVFQSLHLHFGR